MQEFFTNPETDESGGPGTPAISPRRLIVAVPVAAQQTCEELQREADDVICAYTPEPFLAVGIWYEDFSQTTDEEVQQLLKEAEQQAIIPQDQGR